MHTPLPHLAKGLRLVYLHGLYVLKIPGETAHHLPLWVDLTLFENPTFRARNDALWRPSWQRRRLEKEARSHERA
jgi:hypothetical protein